ncbi:hypothetical protein [Undibacterium sp. Di24W]|uniref:hypothetical protein n=1 Tax=Undibacterium sp. Di24W TaxID=3413033 RepID=UPI003BF45AB9
MTKPFQAAGSTKHVVIAMFFISLLFFILGFVNWLNGSLIPFLKIVCDLNDFQALWVTFAFYIAYTVMALPSAAILSRIDYKNGMTLSLGVMAVGLILFMSLIHFSKLPELDVEDSEDDTAVQRFGVLQFPQLVLGAIALFAYVGVEVIAGDTIGLYGHHLGVNNFAVLTSYTMSFMALGYLFGATCIPRLVSQKATLLLSALSGIGFTIGVIFSSATDTTMSQYLIAWAGVPEVPNTVMFLALLGLANALVWPSIWPLALEGLGKYTASGSALLIMGIAGGALLPMIYGHFSDTGNAQGAYWIMLPCYVFILLYAVKGHAIRSWRGGSASAQEVSKQAEVLL